MTCLDICHAVIGFHADGNIDTYPANIAMSALSLWLTLHVHFSDSIFCDKLNNLNARKLCKYIIQ